MNILLTMLSLCFFHFCAPVYRLLTLLYIYIIINRINSGLEVCKLSKLVSVVIPTYKREVSQISAAVESVLAQMYDNLEIVVVDDSPADYPHRSDIREYFENLNDSRILYHQNEVNLGGCGARNKGVEIAHGELIAFLDDDDEFFPDKIKKQTDFMVSENCDVTFSDLIMYNDAGKVVDYRSFSDIKSYDNDYLLKYHLMHHMTGTSTFMFRRDKFLEIGGFDESKVGQEFRLMLKAIEKGLSIRYYADCQVKMHKHAGAAISKGSTKIQGEKDLLKLKKKYFDRLSVRERIFIKFRFYAVLAVVCLRNKNYPMMLGYGILAVLASPADSVAQLTAFLKKVREKRK